MGFGIMFLGFFFLYIGAITPLNVFTAIIGSAIILLSLKELIYQNKLFMASAIGAVLLVIVSVGCVFVDLLGNKGSIIYDAFFYAEQIIAALLGALLMLAIYVIAKSVELTKIQTKCIITLIFMGIYAVCLALYNTVFTENEFALSRLYVVIVISQILYSVLGLVTVFNSYMRICYADDKDMTKKAGNGPMDFLNDKLNTAMTPKERRNNDRKNKK
jgi:hypothetical protein